MRARGVLIIAVLAAMAAIVLAPSRAWAHAVLRLSAPASGENLSVAPHEIRLTFSEAVEAAVASFVLLGPDSTAVALSPVRSGDSSSVLVADITGRLRAGSYTVQWRTAGRDGHAVRGSFRFAVAPEAAGLRPAAPGATAPTDSAPVAAVQPAPSPVGQPDARSPLYAAVRWLGFAALLAIVGGLGFGLVVLPAAERGRDLGAAVRAGAERRLRAAGVVAGATLLLSAGLRLITQSVTLHGDAGALDPAMIAAMVGHTLWGTAWIVQLAAALLATLGYAVMARRRTTGFVLAATAAVAAALSMSLSGHAAAVPGRSALAVAVDATHALAAGGWLGTLLMVALAGLPTALGAAAGERRRAASAMVNAFSPLALLCAAGVAITGAISAWLHLGSPGALLTSTYGRTLLIKLAVVALVVATGAYNWRRMRPAMGGEGGPERLRRSAATELLVGAVVIAVTAVLVATPTPLEALR